MVVGNGSQQTRPTSLRKTTLGKPSSQKLKRLKMENIDTSSLFKGSVDASLKQEQLSPESFREELTSKVEAILIKEFKDPIKRRVKQLRDSINFACPYCGDSATSSSKKRGHLIMQGQYSNLFKCFNCGICKSFHNFFRDFNEELSLGSLDYMNAHKLELGASSAKKAVQSVSLLVNKESVLSYSFSRDFLKAQWNLVEISSPYAEKAKDYLDNRLQKAYTNFLYSPHRDSLVILNLIDNNIIAVQFRDLSGFNRSKYMTFGLKKLHEKFMTGKEVPEAMNEMSMLFNLFSVDISKPVIVLEGPMDSFLIKNSIASCGAFKNIKLEIDFWFLYDSDKAGKNEAVEKIQESKKVFLWEKFRKEHGMPIKKKWDVNDAVVWAYKNSMPPIRDWTDYFSDDPMDMLDI